MLRASVVFYILIVIAQVAPSEPDKGSNLDSVVEYASNLLKDIQKNLPESLKLDSIQNTTSELTSKLSKILEDVTAELNKPADSASKILNSVADNLKEVEESLKKKYPEASAKAEEFKKSLDEALKSLVEQGKSLAESVGSNLNEARDKVAMYSKEILQVAISTAEDLKKSVEQPETKEPSN